MSRRVMTLVDGRNEVRLAALGGADECVRPYVACGNALVATGH